MELILQCSCKQLLRQFVSSSQPNTTKFICDGKVHNFGKNRGFFSKRSSFSHITCLNSFDDHRTQESVVALLQLSFNLKRLVSQNLDSPFLLLPEKPVVEFTCVAKRTSNCLVGVFSILRSNMVKISWKRGFPIKCCFAG